MGMSLSLGPADENQLKISLSDLLLADQQGKEVGLRGSYVTLVFLRSMVGGWICVDRKGVILDSCWITRYVPPFSLHLYSVTFTLSLLGENTQTTESWVLELARKQRMNTEIRRNIFCILMTSEVCKEWHICIYCFEGWLRLWQLYPYWRSCGCWVQ